MKITPHGAAREVTGSCYRLESAQTRILVDCGMHQGSAYNDARNYRPFGFDPSTIDAVIITHTHLDHIGRLPKLIREGFRGPIYLTKPTKDLARILLEDAYGIMKEDFEREYRPMLYELEDVEACMELMEGKSYSRWKRIGDLKFRFRDAGHIFGSAFVELEDDAGKHVVFSGDLGNVDTPILRPTAQMAAADAVFIETTYGNRIHEDHKERMEVFRSVILETIKQRGVLLIPAFAVERTQDLLYHMNRMVEDEGLEPVDTYIDSPMAIRVTDVMKRYPEYYDKAALARVMRGDDFFDFPGLRLTKTRNESMLINDAPYPKIIFAGSGMMTGGRIQHHLVRYLGKRNTIVFIVGYQASGTLGRKIYEGQKVVKVLREMVPVKAKIVSMGSFSAHADQTKLLNWLRGAATLPKHVYCVHGEAEASAAFATRVKDELKIQADVPRNEETITV
ncbi:MBL fold metallo-hydrolase [Candidatus Uhrbacteria bacterium]|nr:MBL fold metallo-hydrolase [Candidatus Uhrbacteria bacterium]MBD3284348.1 MBL fold metallo-hydrolase [Candidatus Uhrbacteria bacterium]